LKGSLVSLVTSLVTVMTELGEALLEKRNTQNIDGEWQGSQLKSSADMFAHEYLVANLNTLTPEIPVISEESIDVEVTIRPECYWLIDPIDGTASYVNGFGGFVTQAALIKDNIPQLGVIYVPVTQECYTAVIGEGAFKNGRPIQKESHLSSVRIIDNYPAPRGIANTLMNKLAPTEYIECGSLSLKALRVLEGKADLFVKDVVVRDWDFAAPIAILNELSGFISQVNCKTFDLNGAWEKNGVVVCRDEELHKRVCGILN